jgi:hypothetical protein
MFERTSQIAEKLATSVSRRGFLGSLGHLAGATALAIAGVLSTAGSGRADNSKTCCYCCPVNDFGCNFTDCVEGGQTCPACPPGTTLFRRTVAHCEFCLPSGCHKPCGGGA